MSAELVIRVSGRFDYSAQQDFRALTRVCRPASILAEASYLDSSALGMLLLLRDSRRRRQRRRGIVNGSRDVRKILAISNFEQLFTIG
jgi:HptB-dependent secretion and biofilm anti anti-sigma factor